jgi:hypothetical protein
MRALASALVLLTACSVTTIGAPATLSSFSVDVLGVYALFTAGDAGVRAPLNVSASCRNRYDGGIAPIEVRGREPVAGKRRD